MFLIDGSFIASRLKQFDRYDLKVQGEDGRIFWLPKHAVLYGEELE